jgi:very-short-patch-repair endonuclease
MTYYKNDPDFRDFRTKLRKKLTPAEAALWNILKRSKIEGRKFRRQYGVGKYVLDFYCPSERLGIELDGYGHFSVADVLYDNKRKRFVNHFGIKIIRFDNETVFTHPEWIVERIKASFGWWKTEDGTTPSAEAAATPP